MQVDLALAVSAVGGVVSVAGTLYAALLRYALAAKEREYDRREGELKKDVDDLVRNVEQLLVRLNAMDRDFVALKGGKDVSDVKLETAQAEVERLREGLSDAQGTLIKVLAELRNRPSTAAMAAVRGRPNESDFPKK